MESAARRLTAGRIEKRAALLLFEYEARFGSIRRPPVPVDDIVENLLKFHLEFDDLRRYNLEHVHAATDLDARRMIIDERLEPVEHPAMEGRCNFTIAHEVGHIWLRHPAVHRIQFPSDNDDPKLVSSHQELEWQADRFAACLFMPRHLVLQEWRAKFGSEAPLVITPEMAQTAAANGFSQREFVKPFGEMHAKEFAGQFKVSVQAMSIRLQELGLLPRE